MTCTKLTVALERAEVFLFPGQPSTAQEGPIAMLKPLSVRLILLRALPAQEYIRISKLGRALEGVEPNLILEQ